MLFTDRQEAGKKLAKKLLSFVGDKQTIVLGLPRGGVVTAAEVADFLGLPLDIIVTRKIGAPFSQELAVGAVTEKDDPILNNSLISSFNITADYLNTEIEKQRQEASRRLKKYRLGKEDLNLSGKVAILVDDGVATGYTMLAAIKSAQNLGAKKIVVAVPVVAADTVEILKRAGGEIVFLFDPENFSAVGEFYKNFDQVTDEEVVKLMNKKYASS